MFKHLLELLLGLDKGFFSADGDLKVQFDPHWPGPLIGGAGSWPNYAFGLAAIGLLVVLFRKSRNPELERVRKLLAVACTVVIVAALPFAAGWIQNASAHGELLLAYGAIALVIAVLEVWFFRSGNEYGRTVLGRIALFAFLLCVISGTLSWNLILAATGALVVLYVYPRDGRSVGARTFLGVLRAGLVAFVLLLLNNPILTRTRNLTEPSVVAVLVDDSLSMKVRDVNIGQATSGPTRLEAAVDLLTGEDQALIKRLAKVHSLRFYSFDRNARALGAVAGVDERKKKDVIPVADGSLLQAMQKLAPEGNSTQVIPSILTVLDDLQGQRLAGVVILTDGRDTPTAPLAEAYKTLANYQVKVYPVAVGSDKAPQNIELQSISVQDSAFKDDIVNVKLMVRATGYEVGHAVKLKVTEKKTGLQLKDPDGKFAEKVIHVADDKAIEQELLFKPDQVGPLDIKVEAEVQPGELDEEDNARTAQISVLDAKINVLYVEGYPRWEYRYIKNEMIRDRTVNISCILTSADPTFIQEHTDMKSRGEAEKYKYFPYPQFPVTMEQLMESDVVLFGDVDPRQFADVQLQLISDFVSKKGGGFGMIAGPQWSPAAYRNTPIETLLPVYPVRTEVGWPTEPITEGFRPVLTKEGSASSIFRFFTDKAANEGYLKNQLQPLFWYCHGITVKPGVGEVYAEHPFDLGPDGRKAPLLVLGRFGSGRTLFSAYDDSWRWR
ncbi:MAG: von Willebrand factor type domain protein, partial [Phycisphaerales bacterium]|nr:von Willebrand factor type domain protein [Phycisphaerales bacterium]